MNTKRNIQKVAVLGSGVMGSQIALHLAAAGHEVLLLDIPPKDAGDDKTKKNAIVDGALKSAIKLKPSPVMHQSILPRVTTGNFDDDLSRISEVDWILEVIVENLEIKQSLYEKVEKFRKPGTLITSNTSGIPIGWLSKGRSDDFQEHFCGTHFFNPPRYLQLLEIIPGPKTKADVLDFFKTYGEKTLGKTVVTCKDTPAFIANRIGVYAMLQTVHVAEDMGLSVEATDKLTGPVIGRPKSATFRTADVVGNDTLIKVADNLFAALQNDEQKDIFKLPKVVEAIKKNEWWGQKSGKGFYQKVKTKEGSEILSLDFKTLEFRSQEKAKFPTLEMTKPVDDLKKRLPMLIAGQDQAGEFYRKTFLPLFAYASNRVPEIADELYKVDDAMRAGFGWELGPFQMWDALGVKKTVEKMKEAGLAPAKWVEEMLAAGIETFYQVGDGTKSFYDLASKNYQEIPGIGQLILLETISKDKIVWSNEGATVRNLGDGILGLEFHSKMNTMGAEVIGGVHKAIELAEEGYEGLVIANEGANFSVGANLAILLMYAVEQEFDEINAMINTFQQTMMRARYSSIPVVVAPHNMALGGGCEMTLHADHVQAHAELYIGLVEFGVGLIPAGGGTKEMTLRTADSFQDGDIRINAFRNAFLTIGQAKVSTSAMEARDLGILRPGDSITFHRQSVMADAKQAALRLAMQGYTQKPQRTDIEVLGQEFLGIVKVGANSMFEGGYITEYEALMSEKLGYVMAGGDLSARTKVSEQYLLDLEREAFLSLCGQRKTQERIQNMLHTGKPLRN